jgi:hypothetical protein
MDAGELDIEDLPPKALRKLIRSMMAKVGKPRDAKSDEDADEEREALADLKEETKGKAPKIPVIEDDLPPELRADEDDEDETPKKAKRKGK